MRRFQTATCFHKFGPKRFTLLAESLLFFLFLCLPFPSVATLLFLLVFGSNCIMTKRDSLSAGFTSHPIPMSMPRRHSRSHGHPSSSAAASDSGHPHRRVTDLTVPAAWYPSRHEEPGTHISHLGYSSEVPDVPLPVSTDPQTPIIPRQEESYPLQRVMAEQRRQLHAHYFTEVRVPNPDSSQPDLRRLMVTEVDRFGNHRNRQPEFFFNGIIGHIRADENGWIDSWGQATHLANYWRRHFQIPELYQTGTWHHQSPESNSENQAGGSQEFQSGSDMEDTESVVVHAGQASAPIQIHQLATVLWNILNNDREANLAILEKLENPNTDPIQIFSAADLAHLASHLAQTTNQLSQQAARMEALSDISDSA